MSLVLRHWPPWAYVSSETHEMIPRGIILKKKNAISHWTDLVCNEKLKVCALGRCVHSRVHVHDGTRFVLLPRAKTAYPALKNAKSTPDPRENLPISLPEAPSKAGETPGISTAGKANVAACMH